jgi:hypothetical protein
MEETPASQFLNLTTKSSRYAEYSMGVVPLSISRKGGFAGRDIQEFGKKLIARVVPQEGSPACNEFACWGVVKWLRHGFLEPAFGGSNPPTPASVATNTANCFGPR